MSAVKLQPGTRNRKLTDKQAREARLSLENNHVVGRRFGVSDKIIEQLRSGHTYGDLRPDERAAIDARRKRHTGEPFRFVDYQLLIGRQFPAGAVGADQDDLEARDAAWECAHGRLSGDRTPTCGCWPQEPQTNPQEATNGSHRERLARFANQALRAAEHEDDRPTADRPVPA